MAANPFLMSLLMGLVLIVIAALAVQLRGWRHDAEAGAGGAFQAAARALRSPVSWAVVFLVLVAAAILGALAAVGAFQIPASVQPMVGTALVAAVAVVFGGFVFLGIYAAVRGRGHGTAPAVGLGSLTVGLLVILLVVANLFLG